MTDISRAGAEARPLRIAYLFQQYPVPSEAFAVSDIAALLAEGHEVTVHTLKRRSRHAASGDVPTGVRVVRPGGAASWPGLLWRWRREAARLSRRIFASGRAAPVTALQALLCLPRLLEIAECVAADRADVVHAFWSRHVGLVLPLLEQRRLDPLRSAFVGAYDLVADDFLVNLTLGAAEIIVSHAEANRPYLDRKVPADVQRAIIRRGIPLSVASGEAERDPLAWVTASSLVPAKNVDCVIRAFADARLRAPRLTLRVCGDGPDRSRLEKITRQLGIAEAVTFAGHVARDQLFGHMSRAAVFMLLSNKPSERLPNVVKEALWAGCTVVSSRSEGIEELIPDDRVGYVVDPGDAGAVGAAITAILSDTNDRRAARRSAARALIAANFSSQGSMRAYVDAWRAALAAAPVVRQPASPD